MTNIRLVTLLGMLCLGFFPSTAQQFQYKTGALSAASDFKKVVGSSSIDVPRGAFTIICDQDPNNVWLTFSLKTDTVHLDAIVTAFKTSSGFATGSQYDFDPQTNTTEKKITILSADKKTILLAINITDNATQGAPVIPAIAPISYNFIPDAAKENSWKTIPATGLPCLNRHTKWMIEYNLSGGKDIVEVWKGKDPGINKAVKSDSALKREGDDDCMMWRKRRMFPKVDRSLFIYVHGYHPYKDSFALSLTYEDRFMEDAGTFTSAIGALQSSDGSSSSNASGSDTTTANGSAQDAAAAAPNSPWLQKFRTLAQQLKTYYQEKYDEDGLTPEYAGIIVGYIKSQIVKELGVSDFTATGFLVFAQNNVDKLSDADKKDSLTAYFKYAQDASVYFNKLASYKSFEPHSVLIKNRDAIEVNFKRFRNGVLQTPDEEASREYNIRGGCKLDFSLGLFGNTNIDKEYTTISIKAPDTTYLKNPNGTQYKPDSVTSINSAAKKDSIVRNNKGKFNIGPAIYAHVYWRTGTRFNGSITTGFSINQEAQPSFLFGGSLLIGMGDGNKSRFVITGGCAVGTVKRLEAGYYEGQKIVLSDLPNSQIPTKEVWKANWFIGISYNLGGVKLGNSSKSAKSKT